MRRWPQIVAGVVCTLLALPTADGGPPHGSPSGLVRVVFLAGQSNAVIPGVLAASAPGPHGTTSWLYDGAPSAGGTADVWGAIENGTQYGPEWGMSVNESGLAIIKHAVGSTSLYDDWQPGGAGTLEAWEATASAAIAALDLCYVNYTVAAFVWVQGETDAETSEAVANAYKENLDAMAAAVRSTYPGVEFVVVELITTAKTWHTEVRAEQAAFVAADSNATLIDTGSGYTTRDGVHYDARSAYDLGIAIAAEID